MKNKKNNKKKPWKGECFVFDNRVSLNDNLKIGSYSLCHACRMPLTDEDKKHSKYIEGESCHLCYSKKTEEQKKRYRMRNSQLKTKEIVMNNKLNIPILYSFRRCPFAMRARAAFILAK